MTDDSPSAPGATGDAEASERRVVPARLRALHDDAAALAAEAAEARDAIGAIVAFVRDDAEPPPGSGVDRAGDDPLVLREIADLEVKLHAAEAVLTRANRRIDAASLAPADNGAAEAAIAVAEARVLVTEVVQAAWAKRAELADAAAPSDRRPPHPTRWTLHAIGNYVVNGAEPPIGAGEAR